ncbi:MAG: hypothetical protein ABSG82_07370 [Sedimentisphaerales bacterium]|jgi:hypothetical protein
MSHKITRRGLIAGSVAGAAGFIGLEERILLAAMQNGGEPNAINPPSPNDAKIPTGKIGNLTISRLILGGNLIGGWAHSRDLMYVSELFKAYNTNDKIFETLHLAEQYGINTIVIDYRQIDLINKYKKDNAGQIQAIVSVIPQEDNPLASIDQVADKGAMTIYLHGAACDSLVKHGRIDVIEKALDHIRKKGLLAGVGGHSVYVLQQCRETKIQPDYWVKTFHHDKYWSAHPKEKREPFSVDGKMSDDHNEYHDNMFCLEPQETIEFMKTEEKPWIAFKTMAAGAILPTDGFRYAFENGADFIAAGMFDFQLKQDTKIACNVLDKTKQRQRPWRG